VNLYSLKEVNHFWEQLRWQREPWAQLLDTTSLPRAVSYTAHEMAEYLSESREIFRGDFALNDYCQNKVIRLYISSTWNDVQEEREALMSDVYPYLKKLCHQLGYDFQPVDLRAGVSEDMVREQFPT